MKFKYVTMKKIRFICIFYCLNWGLMSLVVTGQSTIQKSTKSIILQNSKVCRILEITDKGLHTSHFEHISSGLNYSFSQSKEFEISIDGKKISGNTIFTDMTLIDVSVDSTINSKTVQIKFHSKTGSAIPDISLAVFYSIFDDLPTIRKTLSVNNNSPNSIVLTNLDVERLNLAAKMSYMTTVYNNYGMNLTRIPYLGDYYDPAILVYNENNEHGFILANEASSVLKRTGVYEQQNYEITIGMKYIDEEFPFKKVLQSGKTFTSPGAVVHLFKESRIQDAFEGSFAEFIRKHMGIRLYKKTDYPLFYYCTWNPFRRDINEEIIKEVADGLEGTGFEVLIIDVGWEDVWGDWNPDPVKFPGGLTEVCDYIHSKGMEPGLWLTFATVDTSSKVYKDHPEWAVLDKNGQPTNLHSHRTDLATMSMASGWYDYIYQKIANHIETCKLKYIKLDAAIANSAYVMEYEKSGDYSFEGKEYSDRESSYYELYEATIRLMNELNNSFPDLIIDCTFEVWGRYNHLDYSLIKNADVSWVTNYEYPSPRGPISVRQVVSERARNLPASTMLVGNQLMNGENYPFAFFSLAASVPIMCGDVRNLSVEQKKFYKSWTDWFQKMDKKYNYSQFYQKSDIFGEASLSNWDGVYKFNIEKEGGVLLFYRNDSPTDRLTYPIHCVNPDSEYRIYEPITNHELGIFKGKVLQKEGIEIIINARNSAMVLGIEKALE